jgi:hypothetical protein
MKKVYLISLSILLTSIAFSQTTYQFNGSGNWSDTSNWLNQLVPPTLLPKDDTILIDPQVNGECVLDVEQIVSDGSQLTVQPNKKFVSSKGILSGAKKFNDRVHIINSATMQLQSDSAMLSEGIYEFTSADSIPPFVAGDFILGTTGEGYICQVTSADYSRPANSRTQFFRVLLRTIRAKLNEIIDNGTFSIDMPVDNSFQEQEGNTFSIAIPDVTYQNGPVSITLTDANISLDPKWRLDFNVSKSAMIFFELACRNASITNNFKITFSASEAATLFDETKTLKSFRKIFITPPPFPLVAVMDIDLVLKYSGSIEASIEKSMEFNSTANFDLGVRYANAQWQPIYNKNFNSTVVTNPTSSNVNATINASIGPSISVKLYGVVGPYLSAELLSQAKLNVASPSLDWDFKIDAWGKTTLGVDATILDENIFNYYRDFETNKLTLYKTPDSIIKAPGINGDNQTGLFNQFLPQPVRVRVLDTLNIPQRNVPVYFSITAGGGTAENVKVFTDVNGYAQTRWQLGNQYGVVQKLTAIAKKADGSPILTKPVEFTAKTPTLIGNWSLASFENGNLPGTFIDVNRTECPSLIAYKYTILEDDFGIDSTTFNNFHSERVIQNLHTLEGCTVISVTTLDSTYNENFNGTYFVEGSTITYVIDGEPLQYGFEFLTFDRIRVGQNEYTR